ncbi:hypothetical protein KKD84_05410, partial [Patescibacteria group bacterium]|nr:hypothetical protein [Patescibacteria group bacterium]
MITIIRRLLGITRESLNHAEVHVEPRGSTWRGSPPNFRVLMVLLCSCALVLTCAPGTLHAVDNTFTDDVKGRSGTDVRLDEGMVDTPYGGLGRYENLLTYSDTFDNSVWAKTNVTSPTADQIIAPNGSTTAEALAPTAAAATNVKNTSAAAATASTSYTFSTWLKAASGTKDIVLTVGDTAANNTATASLTTAWQRFSVSYTSSGTPSGNVFGQIGDAAWTADTIHAWGAQLEQASSPGVYAKAAANAITSGRGIISTSDIIMPGLKLTEGDIANIVGNTIILDDDVDITGSLKVTGAGPHYISQGNVGIGTVSPAQKLHVEGQCVTGDTMLSIFEKDVQGSRFKVQGIMIKDVKPGMMVYSLNEELGIIEPHRILALLDMGIKPVFKLITKDGKSIRTTGNHPYLTREGWKKVVELEAGQRIAVPREINGHASYVGGGQYKTKSTQNQGILMSLLWRPLFFSFPGIDNYAQDKQSDTQCYETYSQSNRKFFKEITGKSDSKYGLTKISDNLRDKFSGCFIKNYHDFREQLYHSFDNLSSKAYAGLAQPLPEHLTEQYEFSDMRTIWLHEPVIARSEATPVRRSHIGQNKGVGGKQSHLEPRTSNLERYVLWAEIESIEYIGYEQVYDIEVEGTHNFIGNGIIAHNTYLNGNVGIGTT